HNNCSPVLRIILPGRGPAVPTSRFRCPSCRALFDAPDLPGGARLTCPACSAVVSVRSRAAEPAPHPSPVNAEPDVAVVGPVDQTHPAPDDQINGNRHNAGNLAKYIEIYKCAVLTVIAVLLVGIWLSLRSPVPVRVAGGSVDVNNTVDVEVTNSWPLEVE